MRKMLLIAPLVAVVGVAGAGCSSGTGTAPGSSGSAAPSATAPSSATPAPSPTGPAPSPGSANATSTAGWTATTQAGTWTKVDGTFTLSAQNYAIYGTAGLQLCDSHTGYAVQFGAVRGAAGWQLGYFTGQLPAATGTGGDPCAGNRLLAGGPMKVLASLPARATVRTQISVQQGGGMVLSYATSTAANFNYRVSSPAAASFDEAAAIASFARATFLGPAVYPATTFTGVAATDSQGKTGGLALWQAVLITSRSGTPPSLVTASALSPATGGQPSSFSILTGYPHSLSP